MSATVMYYPQRYVELMDVMRARLLGERPDSWAPNIKIGLQVSTRTLQHCAQYGVRLSCCVECKGAGMAQRDAEAPSG